MLMYIYLFIIHLAEILFAENMIFKNLLSGYFFVYLPYANENVNVNSMRTEHSTQVPLQSRITGKQI